MIDLSTIPQETLQNVRNECSARMEGMRSVRFSWWVHWGRCAEMFLPRRYRWLVTPNNYNRGSPINAQIVDETGLLAARTLATGLLANLTSPTKQWFRLGLHGVDVPEEGPVAEWLSASTQILHDIYSGSNFYQSLGAGYHDDAVFGSAAILQYEDDEDICRFYNPCLGEFFFGLDERLAVNTLSREFTYTVSECVAEFGLAAVSESVKRSFQTGGAALSQEVTIGHTIEPNGDMWNSGENLGSLIPSSFKFREIYWEQGSASGQKNGPILRIAGFREQPFAALRWDVTSNDPYGRSPGMDALPATLQLQIEQRRKAEAIDKMVRPPMVGTVSMKNEPTDLTPGGLTYVSDANAGFKPAFQVEPRIQEMMEDIKEVQSRVEAVFFVPLFTMISSLDTVRTATEIEARQQEKLVLLGPVIERTESEGLDKIINRTFAIASRRGLIPPPPPEIQGMVISIQYISLLAEAQRAASTAAIERVFSFAGNLAGAIPNILDNLDADEALEIYADQLNVPPEIIRSSQVVAAIRAQRDAATKAATALQAGQAMATGAKTLSETDVGGGQNALQRVLGEAA